MPFVDVSADQISAGTFADAYTIDGSFTVGDTAGRHIVLGVDAHGADGIRLYDLDGVTPIIDMRADAAPMVAGSIVTGSVASAINANTANSANTATTATSATNLSGGGTASGSTTIAGELVVGNPATSHVVVGTDGNGADGVRLYGSDGVTPLIDLNISGTPVIKGAIFQSVGAAPGVGGIIIDASNPTIAKIQLFNTSADTTAAIIEGGPSGLDLISPQRPGYVTTTVSIDSNTPTAGNTGFSISSCADVIISAGNASIGGTGKLSLNAQGVNFGGISFDGTTFQIKTNNIPGNALTWTAGTGVGAVGTLSIQGTISATNFVETDTTPEWWDGGSLMPTLFSGTGSFRITHYVKFGKICVGQAQLTTNSSGGTATNGSLSLILPFATNGGIGGSIIGTWSGPGGNGPLVADYNSTRARCLHWDGTQYTTAFANNQQFQASYSYWTV